MAEVLSAFALLASIGLAFAFPEHRDKYLDRLLENIGDGCEYTEWSDWSSCLNENESTRTRQLKTGDCTGTLQETKKCECVLGDWSEWSNCGPDNKRTRTKHLTSGSLSKCNDRVETEDCEDCVYGKWSSWGACNGYNEKSIRTRAVIVSPFSRVCNGIREERDCAVDCRLSEWFSVDECNVINAENKRKEMRNVITQPKNGGAACGPTERWTLPCIENQPCQLGDYNEWSDCRAFGLATGQTPEWKRVRSRRVLVSPRGNAPPCENPPEYQACAIDEELQERCLPKNDVNGAQMTASTSCHRKSQTDPSLVYELATYVRDPTVDCTEYLRNNSLGVGDIVTRSNPTEGIYIFENVESCAYNGFLPDSFQGCANASSRLTNSFTNVTRTQCADHARDNQKSFYGFQSNVDANGFIVESETETLGSCWMGDTIQNLIDDESNLMGQCMRVAHYPNRGYEDFYPEGGDTYALYTSNDTSVASTLVHENGWRIRQGDEIGNVTTGLESCKTACTQDPDCGYLSNSKLSNNCRLYSKTQVPKIQYDFFQSDEVFHKDGLPHTEYTTDPLLIFE